MPAGPSFQAGPRRLHCHQDLFTNESRQSPQAWLEHALMFFKRGKIRGNTLLACTWEILLLAVCIPGMVAGSHACVEDGHGVD